MRAGDFSDEQIVKILRQAESGEKTIRALCAEERGSESVAALMASALDFSLYTTTLGYAETFSVLQRKFRDGRLDKTAFDEAVSALNTDCLRSDGIGLLSIKDAAIMGAYA